MLKQSLECSHLLFSFSFAPQVNFDARCAEEGSRLAVPKDSVQAQAMVDWLLTKSPWVDVGPTVMCSICKHKSLHQFMC